MADKLRYKDYTFAYNPHKIVVEHGRRLAQTFVPHMGAVHEDVGREPRVVRGEGVFFTDGALAEFERLRAVFVQQGAGLLCVPGQPPFMAWFSQLRMMGEAGPQLIQYELVFVEEQLSPDIYPRDPLYHIASTGETLWHIASLYGLSIERLIALNPVGLRQQPQSGERIRVV